MYKFSLFRSYFYILDSLNMSSINMMLRRKANVNAGDRSASHVNATVSTVEKVVGKRSFTCTGTVGEDSGGPRHY